jgi:hypothetical protein
VPPLGGRRFLLSAILIVVIIVVTARIALPAGRMLVTTTLAAVVAILFATSIPDCVRQHLDELDWRRGVVALDHQLARPRTLLIGAVLNLYRETRAWM